MSKGVLSLKVNVVELGVVKTMQFDPSMTVESAARLIREKLPPDASLGPAKEYGLFVADDDPKKGLWIEPSKNLQYYMLRIGDTLEYKKKTRTLKIRMLDGAVKTLLVDDSQPVGQLLVVICTRIGITNHEEYSLVREILPNQEAFGTGTLGPYDSRSATLKKTDAISTLTLGRSKERKMEQLRKQLHTDEEINWVDHSKTLREQDIDESETLLLKRKFFFSDQNIDARDPVQLNLLYVQCRNGVLDGAHPVGRDQAFQLAGLQCQIQFNDYVDPKQRSLNIDLNEFLPKEYIKAKDAEKRLLAEYRNRRGMSELDAKVEYVKLCRSLKTYGVTFFLVKEKLPGKNKLVPRLLGVNKDCVMRVDEKTKEVMKVYPLETVRRWAASTNTFTLDFGDYQDSYYSVQTAEGEKIAQLIAGYIDIILRKKKAKDHLGIEGDEGSTMLEDIVAPAKATLMSHGAIRPDGYAEEARVALPGILRAGPNGELPYGTGSLQRAQYGAVGGYVVTNQVLPGQQPRIFDTLGGNKSQRALLGTIEASVQKVERAKEELDRRVDLPPDVGQRWRTEQMDVQKQQVNDHLAAVGAATAQVVQLTGVPDQVDHTAVGAAISTISSNIPDVTRGVKTIAALMEDEDRGDRLLEAARRLCGAVSDLLGSVNPERQEPRGTVLAAAGKVGDFSHEMIETIQEPTDSDKQYQDILVQLAKQVATSTAQLVMRAKTVSGQCPEQALQERVIHSATKCAFATSQLVACTRVVAPTIDSPACQEQLTDAAKQVAKSVEQLLRDAETACKEPRTLGDLREAAREVSRRLNELLLHIKTGSQRAASGYHQDERQNQFEKLITSTDKFLTYEGPPNEMLRQVKVLAEATTHLVTHIRDEADDAQRLRDDAESQRLLGAARQLAEATSRLIDATKACASSPQDVTHRVALKTAAEDLRAATSGAAREDLRRQACVDLERAVKNVVTSATQTVTAAHACEPYQRSPQQRDLLECQCKDVAGALPRLIGAMKNMQICAQEEEIVVRQEFVSVSRGILQPCARLTNAGRAAVPTVDNAPAASQLIESTTQLSGSLAEMRAALNKLASYDDQSVGLSELNRATTVVHQLDEELHEYEVEYRNNGRIRPFPNEKSDECISNFRYATKRVGSSMSQLLSAAAQGDDQYAGSSASQSTEFLRQMTRSCHGVAASGDNIQVHNLLASVRDVMEKSSLLYQEVSHCLRQPGTPDNQQRLAQVAQAVTYSLNNCISYLPTQRDIDSIINTITILIDSISSTRLQTSLKNANELRQDLMRLAQELSKQADSMLRAASSPSDQKLIIQTADNFAATFKNFNQAVLEAASVQDPSTKERILDSLRKFVTDSVRLLTAVKAVSSEPASTTAKHQASSAAHTIFIESLNRLVDLCVSGAQYQTECENALRNMQKLGGGMNGVATAARNGQMDAFCRSIRDVSGAVCQLAESAAQAAYLMGASDRDSVPGQPALLDTSRFQESVETVRRSCDKIAQTVSAGDGAASPPLGAQSDVLESATLVAKHTSALANFCREASSRTQDQAAKKQFITCARDLASTTANLIKEIKKLDGAFENTAFRRDCAQSVQPLLRSLDNLASFVDDPRFSGMPARISQSGADKQRPLCNQGRQILDGSIQMVKVVGHLAAQPQTNESLWQQLANSSKIVSDSIKMLLTTMRENTPGQAECVESIENLKKMINVLDRATIAVGTPNFPRRQEMSERDFHERLDLGCRQLIERVADVEAAGKREAENVGHRVLEMTQCFEPTVDACLGAASCAHLKRQRDLLTQCRTAAEAMLQLIYGCKDSGGNPRNIEHHSAIDESGQDLRIALKDLLKTLQEIVAESGLVSTLLSEISRSLAKADERVAPENISYADYQTRMIHCCREIDRLQQEITQKCYSDPNADDFGQLTFEFCKNFDQLAINTPYACAAASGPEVAQRIRVAVQDLGHFCLEFVKNVGQYRTSPDDPASKRDVASTGRVVGEKVAHVLAALQAGATGTQACINAASTVSGIIGDLDTTIMFATAGSLHPDVDGETFSDRRDAILKTAKALVEDTKALVSGAASSQEQLAVAAQNAVRTIVQLSDVVKAGAAALTAQNSESQVLVINAVKDVAAALSILIQATKNASGKSFNDPAMTCLKDAAKVMVTNVTSLLKTVKTVEDEHQRGTRALESAIEAIEQEIRAFDSSDLMTSSRYSNLCSMQETRPEDLLRVTRPVTDATAKTVAAGQSCRQDDVIAASNYARKVVSDLLTVCKAAACSAESPDVRYRCMDAGRDVAIKVRELLQSLHTTLQRPGTETKDALRPASRSIAQAVTELVAFAELLKGSDWVDPSDPTVVAESELLGAANSIEAAARKLSSLKPRSFVGKDQVDTASLNFDEQILEAAKSIANAVTALVKAASAAQRELVCQGRIESGGRPSSRPEFQQGGGDDDQWSEGLISAARMVAAAVHSLCEAANALVLGHASEEKLISAAKQVAASTAHLLVACKVKADMNSHAMHRLQAAGSAVKEATEHLVKAARQAIEAEDERTLIISNKMVSGIAQVLNAREEVLRKERELGEARVKLAAIQKAKYKDRPAGPYASSREGSPEVGQYYSDY